MSTPTRPALRYHGGKWRLAPWIIEQFPPHRVYVEPFSGAASVLMRKPRSFAEIINDLDDEVVGLFRLLRSAEASRLVEVLRLTPFSRADFEEAYTPADDLVERARRLVIRSYMGMGSVSNLEVAGATGFRNNTTRSAASPMSSIPSHDWAGFPDALVRVIDRLRGVVVENREASAIIKQQDGLDTLFYCDPPYLPETRSRAGNRKGDGFVAYRHEMTPAQHADLLDLLNDVSGMVVLSGYASPLYERTLSNWTRLEMETYADGARPRVEVLWINPTAEAARRRERLPLLSAAIP